MATKRLSLSVPMDGFTVGDLGDVARDAERLGYTDAWSFEVDGVDCFTPLAAIGLATRLRLGTAIANVFTRGPVPKFVPSFGWLSDRGLEPLRVSKGIDIARTVMARRKVEMSHAEEALLRRTAEFAHVTETMGWSRDAEREVFLST